MKLGEYFYDVTEVATDTFQISCQNGLLLALFKRGEIWVLSDSGMLKKFPDQVTGMVKDFPDLIVKKSHVEYQILDGRLAERLFFILPRFNSLVLQPQ